MPAAFRSVSLAEGDNEVSRKEIFVLPFGLRCRDGDSAYIFSNALVSQ